MAVNSNEIWKEIAQPRETPPIARGRHSDEHENDVTRSGVTSPFVHRIATHLSQTLCP